MPVATLKVSPEIPEFDHGEIDENPIPAPNANNANVSAAAATPPAAIAAHDTADWFSSSALPTTSVLKVMAAFSRLSGVAITRDVCKKFQPSASAEWARARTEKR